MRKMTRVFTIILIIVSFTATISYAQSRRKVRKMEYNSSYNYEVATVAVGVDGTKLIKVWGYGKKVGDAIHNAKELGVACGIFHGYPAAGGGAAAPTPAIINDDDVISKNQAFFDEFFAPGGKYLQYVNLSTDTPPSGSDRVKIKKGYKVGIILSISFDELRKELEKKGIARSLDSGF